jgi:uncharacterized protein YecT (DUF1311 family)
MRIDMKALWISILLAGSCASCIAQRSHQYQLCSAEAQGQMDLNRCADEELKHADADLNAAYRKLLTQAAKANADQAVRKSEQAWLRYRDSYLKAMYPEPDKQQSYGSIYPMESLLIEVDLTREHIRALETLIRQYANQ